MNTIRICEESDAKLMLKDGSFEGYLQLWLDRFPNARGPLERIKEIKEKYGYGLREAKAIFDTLWRDTGEGVCFEIGNRFRIQKRGSTELSFKEGTEWRGVCSAHGSDEAHMMAAHLRYLLKI